MGAALSLYVADYVAKISFHPGMENHKNISTLSPTGNFIGDVEKSANLFAAVTELQRRFGANFYALSGKSYSNILLFNESGELVKYYSDRFGFNNPDYAWESERPMIVLLGDSFIHGVC